MDGKKVTIALQDRVELYEETARRFLRELLDYRLDDCLITDESYLSNFSSCGMPDELADATSSLQELYAVWDVWVWHRLPPAAPACSSKALRQFHAAEQAISSWCNEAHIAA